MKNCDNICRKFLKVFWKKLPALPGKYFENISAIFSDNLFELKIFHLFCKITVKKIESQQLLIIYNNARKIIPRKKILLQMQITILRNN